MKSLIAFAAAALIAAPAFGADDPEQARIAAIVAPVAEAIAAEQARQSRLPPPASTREKLERMGRLDQAGRRAIGSIDFRALIGLRWEKSERGARGTH